MTLFSPTSIMTETEKSTLKISHSASEIFSPPGLGEVKKNQKSWFCDLVKPRLAGSLQLGLLPVQNESNIDENPKIKSMEVNTKSI